MENNISAFLREIPAVNSVIENEKILPYREKYDHGLILECARLATEKARNEILRTRQQILKPLDFVIECTISLLREKVKPRLVRVVNGTGIIVHTNLGRSVLCSGAVKALVNVASGYSNLEYELEKGERGKRSEHLRELITTVTGAEDAIVVNNNAAAVFLILETMAGGGRETVVSRGELVEIGGSFRMPDIMAKSGTVMVEVGTTNKTHEYDYTRAITDKTALIMKIHTSNFRIQGFTSEVSLKDLVILGREKGIPVVEDQGGGVLIDFGEHGLEGESTVQESLAAGAELVCFSGDKIFGGPQAGVIAGKKETVRKLSKNPLARVLRVDKFTIAAMEATLKIYLEGKDAIKEIPTVNMMIMPAAGLVREGKKLKRELESVSERVQCSIKDDISRVGGGAFPLKEIQSKIIQIRVDGMTPNELDRKFRAASIPVVGRIQDNTYVLDLRTLLLEDYKLVVKSFREIFQ